MNETRAIFVILLALAATFIHVTSEGFGLLILSILFFPLTLVALLIALGSIIVSIIHLVRRKKEEKCVRVANQIMAGCLLICSAYSGGMYLFKKSKYDIIVCHCDIDGLFSSHTFLLFSKDGEVGTCSSPSHKITLPIESKGTYERRGDTLIFGYDTLLIDRENNRLTYPNSTYNVYNIEQWQSRDE